MAAVKASDNFVKWTKEKGIRVIHIKAGKAKDGAIPFKDATVIKHILEILIQKSNLPVYVHDLDGSDVLSIALASLRKLQGWSERSYHEEMCTYLRTPPVESEHLLYLKKLFVLTKSNQGVSSSVGIGSSHQSSGLARAPRQSTAQGSNGTLPSSSSTLRSSTTQARASSPVSTAPSSSSSISTLMALPNLSKSEGTTTNQRGASEPTGTERTSATAASPQKSVKTTVVGKPVLPTDEASLFIRIPAMSKRACWLWPDKAFQQACGMRYRMESDPSSQAAASSKSTTVAAGVSAHAVTNSTALSSAGSSARVSPSASSKTSPRPSRPVSFVGLKAILTNNGTEAQLSMTDSAEDSSRSIQGLVESISGIGNSSSPPFLLPGQFTSMSPVTYVAISSNEKGLASSTAENPADRVTHPSPPLIPVKVRDVGDSVTSGSLFSPSEELTRENAIISMIPASGNSLVSEPRGGAEKIGSTADQTQAENSIRSQTPPVHSLLRSSHPSSLSLSSQSSSSSSASEFSKGPESAAHSSSLPVKASSVSSSSSSSSSTTSLATRMKEVKPQTIAQEVQLMGESSHRFLLSPPLAAQGHSIASGGFSGGKALETASALAQPQAPSQMPIETERTTQKDNRTKESKVTASDNDNRHRDISKDSSIKRHQHVSSLTNRTSDDTDASTGKTHRSSSPASSESEASSTGYRGGSSAEESTASELEESEEEGSGEQESVGGDWKIGLFEAEGNGKQVKHSDREESCAIQAQPSHNIVLEGNKEEFPIASGHVKQQNEKEDEEEEDLGGALLSRKNTLRQEKSGDASATLAPSLSLSRQAEERKSRPWTAQGIENVSNHLPLSFDSTEEDDSYLLTPKVKPVSGPSLVVVPIPVSAQPATRSSAAISLSSSSAAAAVSSTSIPIIPFPVPEPDSINLPSPVQSSTVLEQLRGKVTGTGTYTENGILARSREEGEADNEEGETLNDLEPNGEYDEEEEEKFGDEDQDEDEEDDDDEDEADEDEDDLDYFSGSMLSQTIDALDLGL